MELNRARVLQTFNILISQIRLLFLLLLSAFAVQMAINDQAFGIGNQPPGWSTFGVGYYGTPSGACQAQWQGMKDGTITGDVGPDSTFLGAVQYKPGRNYACAWTTAMNYCFWEPGGKVCGNTPPNLVDFYCASGQTPDGNGVCVDEPLIDPPANKCNTLPHPILIPTGDQIETASDFVTADGKLSVDRFYRSTPARYMGTGNFGMAGNAPILGELNGWSFGFALEWHLHDYIATGYASQLYIPDGISASYGKVGNNFVPPSVTPNTRYKVEFVGTPPADWGTVFNASTQWRITETETGRIWLLQTFAKDYNTATLRYSVARPIKITDADGYVQNLAYGSMGELTSVTDSYGRVLNFTWYYRQLTAATGIAYTTPVPTVVKQISLPDGSKLVYAYDPPNTTPYTLYPERLTAVSRQNAASAVVETTSYQYEIPTFHSF